LSYWSGVLSHSYFTVLVINFCLIWVIWVIFIFGKLFGGFYFWINSIPKQHLTLNRLFLRYNFEHLTIFASNPITFFVNNGEYPVLVYHQLLNNKAFYFILWDLLRLKLIKSVEKSLQVFWACTVSWLNIFLSFVANIPNFLQRFYSTLRVKVRGISHFFIDLLRCYLTSHLNICISLSTLWIIVLNVQKIYFFLQESILYFSLKFVLLITTTS